MSANVDPEIIRQAVTEITCQHPEVAAALLMGILNQVQDEEERYWLWIEQQEKVHGPAARAQYEACTPLAAEELPF